MTPTSAKCPEHRGELTCCEVRGRASAFTLVELLAVLVIVIILAAASLGIARYVYHRANMAKTQILLAKLDLAIENFRLDNGYYPTSTIYRSSSPLYHAEVANSALLYSQLTSPRRYVKLDPTEIAVTIPELGGGTYIIDAWGAPIIYYRPVSNVTYQTFNQTISYGYNTVPSTNFYLPGGYDNFTIGPLVNTTTYDLFSYGPDKATYIPGSTGSGIIGWPLGFRTSKSTIDDVTTIQH